MEISRTITELGQYSQETLSQLADRKQAATRRLKATTELLKGDIVNAAKTLYPPHFDDQSTEAVLEARDPLRYDTFFGLMHLWDLTYNGVRTSGMDQLQGDETGKLVLPNHPNMGVIAEIAGAGLRVGERMQFVGASTLPHWLDKYYTHFCTRVKDTRQVPEEIRPSPQRIRELNKQCYQVSRDLLASGENVVIFPDGGRRRRFSPKLGVLEQITCMVGSEPSPAYRSEKPTTIHGMSVTYRNERPHIHITCHEPFSLPDTDNKSQARELRTYLEDTVGQATNR